MSSENAEKSSWKQFTENLKKSYRLVVMNNESFEEVGSYQLSLLNLYSVICAVIMAVVLMVFLLIFFTPIKRLIPGYGDAGAFTELLELNKSMDKLEAQFVSNETFLNSSRRRINNEVETQDDIEKTESTNPTDLQGTIINRVQEDEELREEIELLEQKEKTQTPVGSTVETPLEQLFFTPPVSGMMSEGFMPEKKHFGVDILAAKNTPVKSVMDGYVITSDWTLETGNTIGIQHANSIVTFYKHNSALLKKTGSFVKAGEAVAIIGNTGTLSDGPHLHFELWHKGKPINPIEFINFE